MDNWDRRLQDQVERGWQNYRKKRIHLDTARVDELFSWTGDFMYVEASSAEAALAGVKLNINTNESLLLQVGTKVKTVFTSFYFSNTAQADQWIDLIVGVNFEKMDPHPEQSRQAQAVAEITHANPDTNQAGADQIAERVVITASPLNTDITWLDFGQAAVQDSCYPLEPGDSVMVRISNLDQINVNFEVGGESVWVINEI